MTNYNSDYDIRLAELQSLGGDMTKQYDSVYEIDLEILKLIESGAGGGIQVVDSLPDANENSGKILRLSTDGKIYVAEQSGTRETDVNAPDSLQKGIAYINFDGSDKYKFYGTDVQYHLVANDGTYSKPVYLWSYSYPNEFNAEYVYSTVPASQVTSVNDLVFWCCDEGEIDNVNKTITFDSWSLSEIESGFSTTLEEQMGVPVYLYLVKETEPVYSWKVLNQYMQSVTYSELKSLRDNSQLVAGMQYRITDYVTTTAQEDTQSAGHQFDIIVTADSENILNENARAINHSEIISAMIACDTSDNYLYMRYPDGDNENGYAWAWNTADEAFPSIQDYINENFSQWNSLDTEDIIYTNSETPAIGDIVDMSGTDVIIIDFSNTIQIPNNYFSNSKLESWELKYCLDNDTNRFAWVVVQSKVLSLGYPSTYGTEIGWYIYSGLHDNQGYVWYFIDDAVDATYSELIDGLLNDEYDINIDLKCYTTSPNPSLGEIIEDDVVVTNVEFVPYQDGTEKYSAGTGVIYHMKDEWNNECYFDFKNIKIYNEDYGDYSYLFGNDDEGADSVDGSIDGTSNNNNVKGNINNGKLSIDTNTFLFNEVGYPIVSLQNQINNMIYEKYLNEYLTFESINGTSIVGWYNDEDNPSQPVIEYSFDKSTWTQFPQANHLDSTTYVSIPEGAKLYMRGINPSGVSVDSEDNEYYNGFVTLNQHNDNTLMKIYGNIMSLIDYRRMSNMTHMVGDFSRLFGDYDAGAKFAETTDILHISDASNLILPAIVLTEYCYYGMFANGNTYTNYLTAAPMLPATTLTERCYAYMFANCTSLTTAPVLPATTLANECYDCMFFGCTSLTTAPVLPATTLTNHCYNSMFQQCTSLNYIKCLATNISAEGCTDNWVINVSSTGTFVVPNSMKSTWNNKGTSGSGKPSGWTYQDV